MTRTSPPTDVSYPSQQKSSEPIRMRIRRSSARKLFVETKSSSTFSGRELWAIRKKAFEDFDHLEEIVISEIREPCAERPSPHLFDVVHASFDEKTRTLVGRVWIEIELGLLNHHKYYLCAKSTQALMPYGNLQVFSIPPMKL